MKFSFGLGILILLIFSVSCREDIIQVDEKDLANSSINISTNPEGAQIILNNTQTNKFSPAVINGLTEGNYNIMLRLAGYSDTTITHFVIRNSEVSINVALRNRIKFITLEKIIIAAVSNNNVIGKDGKIPWHSKEEFKHFKSTTMGYPIIMGRKTFESIGKPLKGRLNIVITRNSNYPVEFEDVKIFSSLNDAIEYCNSIESDKIFICGGAEIYSEGIGFADSLLITKMNIDVDGDTFFPEIDKKIWEIDSARNLPEFSIIKYTRI